MGYEHTLGVTYTRAIIRQGQRQKHIPNGNCAIWQLTLMLKLFQRSLKKFANFQLGEMKFYFFFCRRLIVSGSIVGVKSMSRLSTNYWLIITMKDVNKLPWIIWHDCDPSSSIFMRARMTANRKLQIFTMCREKTDRIQQQPLNWRCERWERREQKNHFDVLLFYCGELTGRKFCFLYLVIRFIPC